ncbi:MAG: ABC transporter permease subunit [Clostridiaceae bacterium]
MVQNSAALKTEKSILLQSNKKRINKYIYKYWQYYLFILPTLAYFIIFKYFPMYGIQIAFRNFSPSKGIWGSTWIGFDNFTRFFSSFYFTRLLSNTLLISLYELAFFPLPILFALSLNELGNLKFKKIIQTITYAPYFLSTVVFVSLILSFLDPRTGIINRVIVLLGGSSASFISNPAAFKTIYVLSGVWKTLGWNAIIYLGTLANADPALHEAAQIDGASRLQRIWHINLPCLTPTIVILFILRLGSIMSVGYEMVYLMQNSLNMSGSDIIATYVYRVGLIEAQYGLSAAVGLFNSVINIILILIANTLSRKLTENSLW